MKFEEIWAKIGGFGKYQKLILASYAVFPVLHIMNHTSWNYIAPGHHNHWCKIQSIEEFPEDTQKHIAIPYDSDEGDNQDG